MEQLVRKIHFEIPLQHHGIVWNVPDTSQVYDTTNYIRTQLFKARMMHLERELTTEKMKIEKIKRSLWDYFKKLINPYEYVHLNKPQIVSKPLHDIPLNFIGIANYDPISRAYYKLWEILHDFPLINTKKPIRYAALAEGPGGFIEAFFHYRRKYVNEEAIEDILDSTTELPEMSDKVTAITLCDTKKPQIPGWKKSADFLEKYKDYLSISYGADGTGNLYSMENIRHFCDLFEDDKADFITADGGFDFSDDYSHQEQTLYQLLLAEVIVGLRILKKGGNMVIKVFDFMCDETISIVYLLSSLFCKTYITKPFTSRVMNSERYIVAMGFLEHAPIYVTNEISSEYISSYLEKKRIDIIQKLEEVFDKKEKPILHPYSIPQSFIETIERCNLGFGIRQLTYLSKTFRLVEEDVTSNTINEMKKDQCAYAVSWCKKYKFPIHDKSRLFKEIDTYHYIPIF
jgi:23S rRNA U2552 (ribose-2'-O)-methylase RlmE/FtsJ